MEEFQPDVYLESNDAHSSTSATANAVANVQSYQWCNNCKQVADVKYKRSMEMLKKKILFTDNLIATYTQMKSQNEELQHQVSLLEHKCKEKDTENKLIQKQIKSLLSNKHPSELEKQKEKVQELEKVVDNLNDQIRSMDMTCKMYEDKIQEMREADVTKETERKNYHNEREQATKEIKTLNKTIKGLERENMSLKKKNEVVRERLRRRRSSRGSQATDSEANMSFLSEDASRTEGEDATGTDTQGSFKSPLPDKRKKLVRKHRKSDGAERSDDDHDVAVAHINRVEPVEEVVNSEVVPKPEDDQAMPTPENPSAPAPTGIPDADRKVPNLTVKAEQLVLSSTMKDHMKEMKAKRAYRIFAHRPTSNQLKEMKLIVERLDTDAIPAEDEINLFCVKHTLVGHETHVAKKMLKLLQEQLNKKVCEKLQQLLDRKTMSSSSETDADNTQEHGLQKNVNFAHSENPLGKNIAPIMSSLTKPCLEHAVIEDNPAQEHSTLAPLPDPQTNDTKNHCEENDTKKETSGQYPPPSSKTKEVYENTSINMEIAEVSTMEEPSGMFSSDDESFCTKSPSQGSITMKSPQKSSPVKAGVSRRARTRSMSKSLSEGSDSSFSLDKFVLNPTTVLSPFSDEPIAVSSPNRKSGDVTVQYKQKNNLTKKLTKKKKEANSKVNDSKKMKETHLGLTATGQTKTSLLESANKSEKDINDNQSEFDDTIKHVSKKKSRIRSEQKEQPKEEKPKEDDDLQQNENTCQVKKKPVLINRKKRKANSPTVNAEIGNPTKKKQTLIEKHFAIIKSNNNIDTSKEIPPAVDDAKSLPLQKPKKQLVKKPLVKLHPILTSMQSLPFKVGSESPMNVSPRPNDFNFLPALDNEGMDSSSDSDGSISVFDRSLSANQLDAILTDINEMMAMPLSPLLEDTPSSSMVKALSNNLSPTQTTDVDIMYDEEVEDDNRASISPSANLCTAISFSKEQKAGANKSAKVVMPKKPKTVTQQVSNLRDTPRRFSCEAPIRALPVPTVKPVTKTKSCDPSLLSGTETDTVGKVFGVNEKQLIASSATEAKDTTQTLFHVSSGPFKVVPQNNVIDPQEEKIATELPVTKSDAPSNPLADRVKSCEKPSGDPPKKTPDVPTTPNRFVFKPLTVQLPKKVFEKTAPDKKLDNINSFSVEEALDKIEKDQPADKKPKPGRKQGIGSRMTGKTLEISNYFGNYFDMRHSDSFESVLSSVQEAGIPDKISGNFLKVNDLKVVTWITKLLTHTRGHNTSETLEKLLQSGFEPCDPELDEILHPNELVFVKLLAAVDEVRSKTCPGLLKHTIIPTLLKTLCRYGHGIGSTQGAVQETAGFLMMSSIFHNGSFTHYDTTSLTRIFAALCRCCGEAKALMDLCKWACTNRYAEARVLVILDLVPCWPSAFTHRYPLTGRIFIQMLNMRLRAQAKRIPYLVNLARICEWDQEPKMFTWRFGHIPPVKWTSCAMLQCIERLKNAEMIHCSDETGTVQRLAVEDHDDVYHCLEMYCFMEGMNIVACELIDKEFWPLLNEWSMHVSLSRKNKLTEKKDGCVVAVLKALSTCLLALLSKQKRNHPSQPLHSQAMNYFETICSMVQYFKQDITAPSIVQCAAVATVLTLSACKPDVAYDTVQSWLIATSDFDEAAAAAKASGRPVNIVHKHEKQIGALLPGENLRKVVSYLEKQNRIGNEYRSGKSVSLLLWG